jgi:hypothetical protein
MMIQGLWRSHAQSGALRVHTYSTVELVQVSAVMRSVPGGGAGGAGMVESYVVSLLALLVQRCKF